ncbi:MAG: hypothetical protein EPN93_16445 [Spirochaetes bacterium]|nr:MAG: hypothetical protein EPN93_16445 [Spirochaetota bacterium]
MDTPIARLFREHQDFDRFRERVIALGGEFPFSAEDMIGIGEAYFERYPDCFSNRSCTDVTLGYKLVRLCVIEKLAVSAGPRFCCAVRDMIGSISLIRATIETIVREAGMKEAERLVTVMEESLGLMQGDIDALPIGMIKERFIGGVSYIHNALYLVKSALKSMYQ